MDALAEELGDGVGDHPVSPHARNGRSMKMGVSLPFLCDASAPEPLGQVYALAQTAEEAGFDFLSIGHHVFTPNYPTAAPLVLLASIAARTSRIRLASVIYQLPLYHPVAVAEQVATLDLLSGGRFIFGVGVGYRDYECAGFGVDPRHRGARADEALALMRSAWETGRFDHRGVHFTIPALPAVPQPVQRPHPPVWVGGESKLALRRAARLGDGWVSANMPPLEDIAVLCNAYRGHCVDSGRTPFVCISRDTWVVQSRDELLSSGWYDDMVERHVGLHRMGLGASNPPPGAVSRLLAGEAVSPEEFIEDRLIGGTPEDCIAQITRWRERTGCDAMLLLLNKRASFEQLRSTICLLGAEVLRAVRAA